MSENEQSEGAVHKAPAAKAAPRKTPAKKSATKATAPAAKAAAKKTSAKKTTAKTTTAQKTTAQKTTARRTPRRADSPVTAVGPATAGPATVEPATVEAATVEAATVEAATVEPATVEAATAGSATVEAATVEPIEAAVAGPASEDDVQRAWHDNALAQVLYHDWEAGTYDEKWSISFDDRCITYARDRFSSLVGSEVLRTERWPYRRCLEIGAGTGFFSLNLKQAGVLDEVHVSDVSAGMVESAQRNARALGFEVQGAVAGAEKLPYEDGTFDLVIGHAVIHHIPDVESALREVLRVLRPGGRFVIAGEPTRIGDWYARRLGQVTWKLTTAVTQLPRLREKWAKSQEDLDASSRAAALEAIVDLHTFVPQELAAMAQRAGAVRVHTQSEELLAALLGWPVRTFEAAVNPKALGWGWANFAYRSWRRLSAIDRVLSRALPDSVFYNVGITGTKVIR